MTRTLLPSFNPDMMAPQTLESIFVQREALAEEITADIRESVLTQAKHYRLLVGPRGIGKTHLIALLYHRVSAMDDLRDRVVIAWTREEEWGVASLLDLLVRILRTLAQGEEGKAFGEALARVRALADDPDAAERVAGDALREACGQRVLLLLIENLDEVFRGLGRTGQERLRAYLQNNPHCTIVATSQRLFNGVSLQTSPFYGFFTISHLEALTVEEATGLLLHIARLQQDEDLAALIETPVGRARVRAVHLLAGGNHRIYVLLSQFLTRQSLDELVEAFLHTLDELTPFYQSRMSRLSPQQRKIVDLLCAQGGAVPVKDIAGGCFISHQTASGQLKQLREMGYVQADTLGREAHYELREPLMRLWSEVKRNRAEPVRLLVQFLRVWYTARELREQLDALAPDAQLARRYLTLALQDVDDKAEHPIVTACLRDYARYYSGGDMEHALAAAEELVSVRGRPDDYVGLGVCFLRLERFAEAAATLGRAGEMDPHNTSALGLHATALHFAGRPDEALLAIDKLCVEEPSNPACHLTRAMILDGLERPDEALAEADVGTRLSPDDANAWDLRANLAGELGRWTDALSSLDKALAIDPDDPQRWTRRARVLGEVGRLDEALEASDRAVSLAPSDPAVWLTKAGALLALDEEADAAVALAKHTALAPNNGPAWLTSALVLDRLGRHEEALEAFQKALSVGVPDLEHVALPGVVREHVFLGRSEDEVAALETMLAREAGRTTDAAHGVVEALFRHTRDPEDWRRHLRRWAVSYEEHQATSLLGAGLVALIPPVVRPEVSEVAARTWQDTWHEVGADQAELQLPLRLLDAAVEWKASQDPRILLRLPMEEREILKPLLGLGEDTEGSGA